MSTCSVGALALVPPPTPSSTKPWAQSLNSPPQPRVAEPTGAPASHRCSTCMCWSSFCLPLQVKISMGVTTPERLGSGYVSHLEVGQAVATLVEKRRVSHAVLSLGTPADLKTLAAEGKL